MIMSSNLADDLKGWIPYKTYEEAGELYCKWLFVGNKTFTEPFFDETIAKCKSLPQNSTLKQCISHSILLTEWSPSIETIAPSAIIFHVSRCKSTLLSQLLGIDAENIILAEVPILDEILRWGFNNKIEDKILLYLQSAISFYGAKRISTQQRLFIKTDSWHIHFYHQYRKLYPTIPFIFLYRNPEEVIRSHQKLRGMHAVPGLIEPAIFGIDHSAINYNDLDDYMTIVLETYFTSIYEIVQNDSLAILINYNEGMMNIVEKTAQLTQMKVTNDLREEMEKRLLYHSKNIQQKYAEEANVLQPNSAGIKRCYTQYEQLEKMRLCK